MQARGERRKPTPEELKHWAETFEALSRQGQNDAVQSIRLLTPDELKNSWNDICGLVGKSLGRRISPQVQTAATYSLKTLVVEGANLERFIEPAARLLSTTNAPEVQTALLSFAYDLHKKRRQYDITPFAAGATKCITSNNPKVKTSSLYCLSGLVSNGQGLNEAETAVPAVVDALSSEEPTIVAAAALTFGKLALADVGYKVLYGATPQLTQLIPSKEPSVNTAVCGSIADLANAPSGYRIPPSTASAIVALASQDETKQKSSALGAIGALGAIWHNYHERERLNSAVTPTIQAIYDPREEVCASGCVAYGGIARSRIGIEELTQNAKRVCELLNHSKPWVSSSACGAIAGLAAGGVALEAVASSAPVIEGFIASSHNPPLISSACVALVEASLAGVPLKEGLELEVFPHVKSRIPFVRWSGCTLLGEVGTYTSVMPLSAALESDDPHTVWRAAEALERMSIRGVDITPSGQALKKQLVRRWPPDTPSGMVEHIIEHVGNAIEIAGLTTQR
ncbi:HEAT repeats [uncultured archaeon]|nr:HEAT repeats [uncultured archaeon]